MRYKADNDLAIRLIEDGIDFNNNAPGLYSDRGIINHPSHESLRDFRTAISLGHTGNAPFIYLAFDAYERGEFAESERILLGVLSRNPSSPLKAEVLELLTAVRSNMGESQSPKFTFPNRIAHIFADSDQELMGKHDGGLILNRINSAVRSKMMAG